MNLSIKVLEGEERGEVDSGRTVDSDYNCDSSECSDSSESSESILLNKKTYTYIFLL